MKEYFCGDGNPVLKNYCYGAIIKGHKEPCLLGEGVGLKIEPDFIELFAARNVNGELCLQPLMFDYPDMYEQYPPCPVEKVDLKKLFAIDLNAFKKKLKRGSMKYKDKNGIPILAGMYVSTGSGGNLVIEKKGVLCLNFGSYLDDELNYAPLSEMNCKEWQVHCIPLKLYTEGNKSDRRK